MHQEELLTIGQAAKKIGVSIDTLYRWDKKGKMAAMRNPKNSYRCYRLSDVENYLKNNPKNMFNLAKNWSISSSGIKIPDLCYCPDRAIFKARLSKLESELGQIRRLRDIFPLIVAVAGEIGNNSFDHNLGNWPDAPGVFFSYQVKRGQVVLADRGQGIRKTLKRVKPDLVSHKQAIKVAFTEVVTGRAPESRGNGLKFVREVIADNPISLYFQSGSAVLKMKKNNRQLNIKDIPQSLRGCLVLIKF